MPSVFDRGYPMIDATGSATNQSVTIGTSSAQSAAFAATTKVVRLSSNNFSNAISVIIFYNSLIIFNI